MSDYYKILGLERNATIDQIKKTYKKLAMQYHPDKLAGKSEKEQKEGTEKFKQISEAHAVLSNEKDKAYYDMYGKKDQGQGQNPFGGFSDIFRGGFESFNPFGNSAPRGPEPIQIVVEVTMEEILNGTQKKVNFERMIPCNKCNATGSDDKKTTQCSSCHGKGSVVVTRQIAPGMLQQMQSMCQNCSGNGTTCVKKCTKCVGEKRVSESAEEMVDIPSGIVQGEAVPLSRKGHHSTGSVRGDVICVVRIAKHPIYKYGFAKNPQHIACEMEITLAESLCGFTREIKLLDGKTAFFSSNEIIHDKHIGVIERKGLPTRKSHGVCGNLYLIFKIKRDRLSMEKRNEIYKILTDKEYNDLEIHSVPEDALTLNLEQFDKEALDEEDDEESGPQQAQCRQQ